MTFSKLRLLLFLLSSFGLLLSPLLSFAEDYSNNIGFMKNPPKELKEKFPMCDQFLDVKWIRQFPNGGWVGTVTADVYFGAKKEQRELVVMQGDAKQPNHDSKSLRIFDVTEAVYRGDLLKSLIISAESVRSTYRDPEVDFGQDGFAVRTEKKLIRVTRAVLRGKHNFTGSTQNVCVTLPKGEASWLIEVNKPFLDESRMSKFERVRFEGIKSLIAKECQKVMKEIETQPVKEDRAARIAEVCTEIAKGQRVAREIISLADFDGDGHQDYLIDHLLNRLPIIAFHNDKDSFLMPYPQICRNAPFAGNYYHPNGKKLEEQCIASEKKKYLQNIKNSPNF